MLILEWKKTCRTVQTFFKQGWARELGRFWFYPDCVHPSAMGLWTYYGELVSFKVGIHVKDSGTHVTYSNKLSIIVNCQLSFKSSSVPVWPRVMGGLQKGCEDHQVGHAVVFLIWPRPSGLMSGEDRAKPPRFPILYILLIKRKHKIKSNKIK